MAARFAERYRHVAWASVLWVAGCTAGPAPVPAPSAVAPPAPPTVREPAPVVPVPPPPPPIAGVPASVAQRVDQLVARVAAGRSVVEVERAAGAIAEYGPRGAPSIGRGLPDAPPRARALLLDVLGLIGDPGCGVHAVPWLDDADWRVREAAARVCVRHRTPAARTALIARLHDPVGRVRAAAATACGTLRDPEVTAPLAMLAAGAPGSARQAAVAALARTPGAAAVRALAAAVTPAAPSAAAVRALASRATQGAAEARAALEAVVDTESERIRRPALIGLARSNAVAGSAVAARAVAKEVAAAMRPQLGPVLEGPDGAATLDALGAPALQELRRRIPAAERPMLVEACLRLQRIPGDEATAGLRIAAEREDCPPFVVQELGRRGDAESVPLLIRHAEAAGDVASAAVQALADIGGPAAIAGLSQLLTHDRPRTRGDAASGLAEAAGAAAAARLAARLDPGVEADAFARWLALQALSIADPVQGAAQARHLVQHDPAARVREGAASVVGRLGRARTDGALLAAVAVGDTDADVRYTALQHARAAGAASALLLPALTDPVYLVRALALAELGPEVPAAQLRARAKPPAAGADHADGPDGAGDVDLAQVEPDETIRATAVAIAAARALAGEPLAELIAAALGDPDEETRIAAVHGLTLSHPAAAGAELAAALLDDESEGVRVAAMRVLAAAGDPRGAAAALAGLGTGDHGLRLEAADALLAAAPPGAAASLRARFEAQPTPEREERMHLLRCLAELGDAGAAPHFAAEAAALGLRQRGLRRGRDTAASDRTEVVRFRLFCYQALAAIGSDEALTPLRAASDAPEQHLAVPALVARAGRALAMGDARAAAGFARTALELDPADAHAWVMVWRVSQRGALAAPEPTANGPHPNAIAAELHRLGFDAAAVGVLRHASAVARGDAKIAWTLSVLLDWLGRFDEANAARAESVRLSGGRADPGAGQAERSAPGPEVLRRRARRDLAAGDPAGAIRSATAALVRSAEPSGTPDEWIALLAQVTTAAGRTDRADRCWTTAARAALSSSRLRLDLVDGSLFALAAAAARRSGAPGADRFAEIARRRALPR